MFVHSAKESGVSYKVTILLLSWLAQKEWSLPRCHYTKPDDNQYDGIMPNDAQHDGILPNDSMTTFWLMDLWLITQYDEILPNDTQHDDILPSDSMMTFC